MANNNHRIKVELDFSADTKAAKSAIQELSKSLNSISEGKFSGIGDVLAKDLQEGQKAAAQLKAILNESFNVDTGKLDLGRFQQAMKKANTNLNSLRYNLQGLGPVGVDTFINLSRSITMAEIPVFRLNDKIKKLGATFANTMRWQISSSVLNMMVGAVQNAFQYAQDLNESLTNIRIVTGYSAEAMDEFASHANKAAKALSTTTNEYAKASLIYFQQGLSDAEVEKRTATTIKLANVTGESAETVSEWMTAVWNNFDDGSKALEHYADVMTALGAATASSSDEIAGGLEKFAAIAKTIGLSYEYAASALATVTAVTRQSEDVVGTAFKTIFGRMEGLELGQTLDDGVTLNKYSEALSSVGVQILDVNGELKDMDTILNDLGGRWDSLSQGQKVALAQVVGGMRQYNQLIALMDNWEYFQENLTTATNSSGELNRQADIYAESWQAASDKVQATLEEMYNKLLNDDTFVDLINGFADFLELINDAIDSIGGLKGVLFALGAVLTSVFSDKIIKSLSTMSLNFQTMTKKGRERIQQMKQEAYDQAAQSIHDSSPAMSARITAVVQESKLEDAFQKKLSKQSEIQQAIYRAEIETLKVRMKKNTELGESVDLLKKEADQQKKNFQQALSKKGQHSHFTTLGSALENFDGSGTEGANAKNAKILEGLKGISNKNTIAKKTVKELQDALEAGTLSIEQFEKGIQKIYGALSKDLSKSDRYKDEVKEIDAALDNATNATNDYIQANKELEAELEKTAQATNDLEQKMNDLKLPPLTWEEKLVGIANAAMQAGMAISALSSIGDTLTNDELSGWEKLEQILMSLSMLVPSLVSIFKAFNSERWEQVTTTWAQVAAEAALKKVQGNGDLDLKNNFRKNKDGSWDFITKDKKGKETASRVTDKTQLDQLNKGEYSNIKLTKNQSGQVFGGGKFGNFKAAFKGGAGKMMGGAALIAAGIAVAAGTIYTFYKVINKENEEAQRAEKRAKALADELAKTKQRYEELKQSMSQYKEGVDGLKQLTKGTLEYSEAISKANEEALKLIKNNPELKYTYDEDGLIKLDEDALKKVQEKEFKKTQALQAASLRAEAEALRQRQEADQQKHLRSVGDRTGAIASGALGGGLGGAGAGALIGAGIGMLGGPLLAGIGALIGAGIGIIGGAITGGVTGQVDDRETQAMEALYNKFNEMQEAGQNTEALRTEEGIAKALKEAGFGDMVEALTDNVDATYELMESNYQMLENEKLALKETINAKNSDNKAYADSLYKQAMQNEATRNIKNRDAEWQKQYDKNVKTLLEDGTYLNENLWNTYLKSVYGEDIELEKEQEGAYRVRDRGGDYASIERYNAQAGKWEFQSEIHENDALAEITTNQRANLTPKEIADMEEKFAKQSAALYKAGIKNLQERVDLIAAAAETENNAIKNVSDFNKQEIEKIRQAGFNVDKALKNREDGIKNIKEGLLSTLEKDTFNTLADELDKLSENEMREIQSIIIQVMDNAGPNALANLELLLSEYNNEQKLLFIEAAKSIEDWSAPGVMEQLLIKVEELAKRDNIVIDIDKSNPALQSFANEMAEAALKAQDLAQAVEKMSKRISAAIKDLKDQNIGDIISEDAYNKLIANYSYLSKYFIKTIDGYQITIGSEQLQKDLLRSEMANVKKILSNNQAAKLTFQNAYENIQLVDNISTIRSSTSSFTDKKQQIVDLYNNGLINDIMLEHLGENINNIINSTNEEDFNAFLNNLERNITDQGNSGYKDAINIAIDMYRKLNPRANIEEIEKYLNTLPIPSEQIAEHIEQWRGDIALDNWTYFIEDVLGGKQIEYSKENVEELQNSFSKLNDKSFTSAKLISNLSDQMSKLSARSQFLENNAPQLLDEDVLANMNSEDRWKYYEGLKAYRDELKETVEALEEIDRQMADSILKAFQDWSNEFDKINKKAEYFESIVDNYRSIVDLTRGFTDIDRSVIKALDDAAIAASETKMANAKNRYKALLQSKAIIEDEMRAAAANDIGGNKEYWQKQLDEINSMVEQAHTDYLNSWKTTLEAAANAYKNTIEEMFNEFEKQMTGTFGTYDKMLETYEQQKKISKLYLADYEKIYELSKLTRNIEQKIDETDNLKTKASLRKLQEQINILSQDDTQMSKYQLEYLQKQYDLQLAQIALEEAQNAKHQVRLQRTASGSWGYVYTADDSKIDEAQQNYEDKIFEIQQLNAEYIEQMTDLYLQLEGEFVEKLKEIYLATDLTEAEREAAIEQANAYYTQSLTYYSEQLGLAIDNNNKLYQSDTAEYENAIGKKLTENTNFANSFDKDVVGTIKGGYDSIEQRISDFLEKLGSVDDAYNSEEGATNSLMGQLQHTYEEYRDKTNKILDKAGTDFEDLGKDIKKAVGNDTSGIIGELADLKLSSSNTAGSMITDIGNIASATKTAADNMIAQYSRIMKKYQDMCELIGKQYNANIDADEKYETDQEEFNQEYFKELDNIAANNFYRAKEAWLSGADWSEIADILYRTASNEYWAGSKDETPQQQKEREAKEYFAQMGVDGFEKEQPKPKVKVKAETHYETKDLQKISSKVRNTGNYYEDYLGDELWDFHGMFEPSDYKSKYIEGKQYFSLDGKNWFKVSDFETYMIPGFDFYDISTEDGKAYIYDIDESKEVKYSNEGFLTTQDSVNNLPYDVGFVLENIYGDTSTRLVRKYDPDEKMGKFVKVDNHDQKFSFDDIFSWLNGEKSLTFNTGGYTGTWGTEGRWAMLHQKEIVLNATDTENFLSAIGILRSIVEMIDLRAATNAFNSSTLRAQNISTQSQILEQQVTIHAEFPNVIDHYEIETALNDIVNSASQYANRKI